MMRLLVIPALAALSACASIPTPSGPLTGDWGGTHVGLKLTAAGGCVRPGLRRGDRRRANSFARRPQLPCRRQAHSGVGRPGAVRRGASDISDPLQRIGTGGPDDSPRPRRVAYRWVRSRSSVGPNRPSCAAFKTRRSNYAPHCQAWIVSFGASSIHTLSISIVADEDQRHQLERQHNEDCRQAAVARSEEAQSHHAIVCRLLTMLSPE